MRENPPVYEKQPHEFQQRPQYQRSPLGQQQQVPQQEAPQQEPPQQQAIPIPGQFYIINGQTCVFTASGYVPIQQPQQQQQLHKSSKLDQMPHIDVDGLHKILGIPLWKALLGFGIFSILFIGLFFGLFFGLIGSRQ
jgi:hypothetical protein